MLKFTVEKIGKLKGELLLMEEKFIMALDAGTTSNRCILFRHDGSVASIAQKEFT